jgi:hypothetical protein
MDYLATANLRADADFVKRVEIAIAKFALYILAESPSTPNHAARYRWADQAIKNTPAFAQALLTAVVLDAAVQADGALISDALLQSAVEAQVNIVIQ